MTPELQENAGQCLILHRLRGSLGVWAHMRRIVGVYAENLGLL